MNNAKTSKTTTTIITITNTRFENDCYGDNSEKANKENRRIATKDWAIWKAANVDN